jgi:DNA-binding response OmpR family regulator
MTKILFLEDDEVLAESLIELLEAEDFHITHVENSEAVLEKTFHEHFDIYLFDVNVPDINGFELLKQLRESGDNTVAIFLTALSDIASLAEGFDVGADDYIKKPFDFDELLIRLHVVLKKQYKSYANQMEISGFVYDIEKNELSKEGSFIPLSPYELTLTQLFFKNIETTLTKEHLLQELSYDDKEMSEGSLRVHINKLRKIGLPITTIKGVGYRLGKS